MFQNQLVRSSSYRDSLDALEADIHHANTMAAAVRRAYGGVCLQMRLSCSPFTPICLFLMQWMDCTCAYALPNYLGLIHVLVYKVYFDGKKTISSYERTASLHEFYGVIYPSLQQLESSLTELEDDKERSMFTDIFSSKSMEEWRKLSYMDSEREDECGICMEACTKMVLPNCNHAMCINCYHDWSTRSESCPFCRGSLKRVASRDLWVLTSNSDIVDTVTLAKDDLRRLYQYVDKLPLSIPDTLFLVYYDYVV